MKISDCTVLSIITKLETSGRWESGDCHTGEWVYRWLS